MLYVCILCLYIKNEAASALVREATFHPFKQPAHKKSETQGLQAACIPSFKVALSPK